MPYKHRVRSFPKQKYIVVLKDAELFIFEKPV